MYSLKSFIAVAVAAVCALIAPASASAADAFPNHPIRIIVPFAPGGGIDILARTIAQQLTGEWKARYDALMKRLGHMAMRERYCRFKDPMPGKSFGTGRMPVDLDLAGRAR